MAVVGEDLVVRCKHKPIVPETDLCSFIRESTRSIEPTHIVTRDTETGKTLSLAQYWAHVDTVAANLYHTHGFRAGHMIAIYCHNCSEFLVVILAVLKLGGSLIPVNRLLTKDEIFHQVAKCNPWGFFTSSKLASTVLSVRSMLDNQFKVFALEAHPHCISWSTLLTETSAQPPRLPADFNLVDSTAFIMSSSGTTGLPKAVELTHRNMVAMLVGRRFPRYSLVGMNRILYVPMSHTYGIGHSLFSLADGATLFLMPAFDLKLYLNLVTKYKIQVLQLVPPVAIQLTKSELTSQYDLKHVTEVYTSGASLPPDTYPQMKRHLSSNVLFRQGYGLTETSSAVTLVPNDCLSPDGTIGQPIPNIEMKIIDQQSGQKLPANQHGEILIRGPNVMRGYYGNALATRETIDSSGWLHSGDLGYYDDNGNFFLTGRIKDVIKYSGYQVSPQEVEAVLLTHPAVADAGVIGIPNREKGELPCAWVVLKPDRCETEKGIVDFVAGKLAPYKRLRGGVKFVDSIPRTSSGKILRWVMKRQMASAKL